MNHTLKRSSLALGAILGVVLFLSATPAWAKLKVVTTTTNLADVTQKVGGDYVSVTSIAKGSQDVHFIEAKPSYMVKLSKADLLIAVGFDLEAGWLPLLQRGSRNPKVNKGTAGYLEVAELVPHVLEKPKGKVTRADGDVHPDGNPHVMLSPTNAVIIADAIAKKLGELDKEHAEQFLANSKKFAAEIEGKMPGWKQKVEASKVTNIVTYHKTLSYFLHDFGIKSAIQIEPKPGVPPSTKHVLKVIKTVKDDKIPLILVANYFDDSAAKRIQKETPGVKVEKVPAAVGGAKGADDLIALYDLLVTAVSSK